MVNQISSVYDCLSSMNYFYLSFLRGIAAVDGDEVALLSIQKTLGISDVDFAKVKETAAQFLKYSDAEIMQMANAVRTAALSIVPTSNVNHFIPVDSPSDMVPIELLEHAHAQMMRLAVTPARISRDV